MLKAKGTEAEALQGEIEDKDAIICQLEQEKTDIIMSFDDQGTRLRQLIHDCITLKAEECNNLK